MKRKWNDKSLQSLGSGSADNNNNKDEETTMIRLPDEILIRVLSFFCEPLPETIFDAHQRENNAGIVVAAAAAADDDDDDNENIPPNDDDDDDNIPPPLSELFAIRASNNHKLRRMADNLLHQPARDKLVSLSTTQGLPLQIKRPQVMFQMNLVQERSIPSTKVEWVEQCLADWNSEFSDTLRLCGTMDNMRNALLDDGEYIWGDHDSEHLSQRLYLKMGFFYSATMVPLPDYLLSQLKVITDTLAQRHEKTQLRRFLFRLLLPHLGQVPATDVRNPENATICRVFHKAFQYFDEFSVIIHGTFFLSFPLADGRWVELRSSNVTEHSHS
mmetsp:Transcript_12907/g.35717  ORF Transcript_12907/g.35717 Transcript_12907/m.35717 type:complete len:329 (+) Transcript_12907:13-999(+)